MGYAIAQAAFEAGATVQLISGPTGLDKPYGCERHQVQTAQQMHDAVLTQVPHHDIFISVAAVADWRVTNVDSQKLKKNQTGDFPQLSFAQNPDILAEVASLTNPPFCVGFAAETENLIENGTIKRLKKNVPMLVGNIAQNTFGKNHNELVIFDSEGHHVLPLADKLSLARQLITEIVTRL
jgi:phosphopantothenoylcysteine decarboxylase/phosphopantothenate--cysteine ligase